MDCPPSLPSLRVFQFTGHIRSPRLSSCSREPDLIVGIIDRAKHRNTPQNSSVENGQLHQGLALPFSLFLLLLTFLHTVVLWHSDQPMCLVSVLEGSYCHMYVVTLGQSGFTTVFLLCSRKISTQRWCLVRLLRRSD